MANTGCRPRGALFPFHCLRGLSQLPCVLPLPIQVYRRVAPDLPREMEADLEGWWCVRYCGSLAWVEAPSEGDAVRRSLDLYRLGDWTNDARHLDGFAQDAYPEHAVPHDYTRAVLNARPSPGARRRAHPRTSVSSVALACLIGVLALGLVHGVYAETWRGLTVAPEHRCAPYDKKPKFWIYATMARIGRGQPKSEICTRDLTWHCCTDDQYRSLVADAVGHGRLHGCLAHVDSPEPNRQWGSEAQHALVSVPS